MKGVRHIHPDRCSRRHVNTIVWLTWRIRHGCIKTPTQWCPCRNTACARWSCAGEGCLAERTKVHIAFWEPTVWRYRRSDYCSHKECDAHEPRLDGGGRHWRQDSLINHAYFASSARRFWARWQPPPSHQRRKQERVSRDPCFLRLSFEAKNGWRRDGRINLSPPLPRSLPPVLPPNPFTFSLTSSQSCPKRAGPCVEFLHSMLTLLHVPIVIRRWFCRAVVAGARAAAGGTG